MGARSGIALKSLQWFIRGIQFCCAAIVFGIYTYFLVTLHDHKLNISTTVRAVEGISGSAVLYTILGLLLVCCLGGIAFTSFIAMIIDLAFVGAFIYVAQANKGGASKCTGYVNTPYGSGQASDRLDNKGKISSLPKFHTACKLETACLAVSIVAIFFFIFSIFIEWSLARHHQKEKRFGPGPQNDYTSGYSKRRGGIFGKLFGRKNKNTHADDTNALPEHTHPDQLDHTRPSNVTDTTAVATGDHQPYHKQETGYGYTTNDSPYQGETYQHAPTHNPYSGDTYQHTPTSNPYSVDTYQHNAYRGATNTNALPQNYSYNDGVYDRV